MAGDLSGPYQGKGPEPSKVVHMQGPSQVTEGPEGATVEGATPPPQVRSVPSPPNADSLAELAEWKSRVGELRQVLGEERKKQKALESQIAELKKQVELMTLQLQAAQAAPAAAAAAAPQQNEKQSRQEVFYGDDTGVTPEVVQQQIQQVYQALATDMAVLLSLQERGITLSQAQQVVAQYPGVATLPPQQKVDFIVKAVGLQSSQAEAQDQDGETETAEQRESGEQRELTGDLVTTPERAAAYSASEPASASDVQEQIQKLMQEYREADQIKDPEERWRVKRQIMEQAMKLQTGQGLDTMFQAGWTQTS